MREARRWLLWRAEPDGKTDKPRKTPYYITGTKRHGKMDTPEDRAQMATFSDACAALDRGDWSGLGFALGPDDTGAHWQGIDLDHLSEHPELSDVAADLPGYVERSPSGDGLHAIGCGERFPTLGNNKTGIEAYSTGRYFTVTGDIVGGWIEDLSGFVSDRLRPLHKPHVEPKTEPKTETPHTAGTEPDDLIRDLRSALWHIDADDYAAWIAAGLALKKLGSQGRALWLDWSSTSPKFDAADAAARWEGFEPTSTDYRAIFAEAQRCGWTNPKKRDRDAEPPKSETEEKPSRLRVCDLSGLRTAELDPPAFVVEPLIPRGYLTLFGGHGGSGKSVVALVLAAHVACGRNWAGLTVTSGRVMFVSFEDNEKLIRWRLKQIAHEYVLNYETIERNVVLIDATESAAIEIEASVSGVKRTVTTTDGDDLHRRMTEGRFDLAIIDNASDAYGGEENNRQQVRGFVRRLAACVEPHDGAVLLLAHIDKTAARYGAAGNSYSGSTAWHNSARSRLALVDDEVRQEKLNVGKKLPVPIPLAWMRTVPVPLSTPGAVAQQSERDAQDDRDILACFAAAAEIPRTIPAADQGPNTYPAAIVNYPECPPELRADKRRIKASVTRLLRSGQVRQETYKNSQRKEATRLVLQS
jgi:hypothetical protein